MSLKGSYQCGGSSRAEWRRVDSTERLNDDWMNDLVSDCIFDYRMDPCKALLSAAYAAHDSAPLGAGRADGADQPDPYI